MSDLSIGRSALDRSHSQLGVASYFDPAQFELERARIFEQGAALYRARTERSASRATSMRCRRKVKAGH